MLSRTCWLLGLVLLAFSLVLLDRSWKGAADTYPAVIGSASEEGDGGTRTLHGFRPDPPRTGLQEVPSYQLVRVQDVLGYAVRGATIRVDERDRAVTDEVGEASFESELGQLIRLEVIHPSHEVFVDDAFLTTGDPYLIRLSPHSRLEGRVMDRSGLGICDVPVFAIPSTMRALGWRSESAALLGEYRVQEAFSGPDGRFFFSSLDPVEEYALVAATSCLTPVGAPPLARLGEGPVTIVVQRFRVARISLEDELGGPPPSIGGVSDNHRFVGHVRGAGRAMLMTPLAREIAWEAPIAPEELIYFVESSEVDGPSAVEVRGAPPGYAPFSVAVPLIDCESRPDPVVVKLKRLAAGFGHVRVEFPPLQEDTRFSGGLGQIVMRSADGDVTLWPLDWCLQEERLLTMPWGQYELRFQGSKGIFPRWVCEPEVLEIGPSVAEIVLLAAEPVGAMRLHFEGAANPPSALDVIVTEGHPTDGPRMARGGRMHLQGEPFIPWLPPGPYTVVVRAPSAFERWIGSCQLLAGEVATVVLREPPPGPPGLWSGHGDGLEPARQPGGERESLGPARR